MLYLVVVGGVVLIAIAKFFDIYWKIETTKLPRDWWLSRLPGLLYPVDVLMLLVGTALVLTAR